MTHKMKFVTDAAAVAAGTAGAANGKSMSSGATERAIWQMKDGASGREIFSSSPHTSRELPAPVARYFEFALAPGHFEIRIARIAQSGEFRLGAGDNSWRPLKAVQHFTANPPGFVWDARVSIAPPMTDSVRDSYIHGKGAMQAKLASLILVVGQSTTPKLASGALLRYMAESAWMPTALRNAVVWEAIDDTSARATLTDSGISVSMDFETGSRGEITRGYSAGRYRDVSGTAVLTPWECRYGDYQCVNEVMVPLTGEVEWILLERRLPYSRLHLDTIYYK